MSSIFEEVKSIIIEQLGCDPTKVEMTSSFTDDLGADSLDLVELVMAFEEKFGVEIPDSVSESIRTVKDAVEQIQKLKN